MSRNGKHAEHPRSLLSGDSFALASRHSAVPGRCFLQQCCRPQVSRVASTDGPAQAPSTHVACRALPDFFCPWSARGYLHDEGANRRAVRKAGCAFPGSDEAYEFSPVRLANESKKLRRTDPRSRCAARTRESIFPAFPHFTSAPRGLAFTQIDALLGFASFLSESSLRIKQGGGFGVQRLEQLLAAIAEQAAREPRLRAHLEEALLAAADHNLLRSIS